MSGGGGLGGFQGVGGQDETSGPNGDPGVDGGALLRTLDVGGPVNIAPTVSDFAAGTDEDSPLPGQLSGTDPNGDPLTFHATGAVPVGLTVNPDGSWSFDPTGTYDYLDQGEQTTVTFQYQANDGSLDSNVGTATITITGLNDAPVIGVASVTGGSVTEAGDLPQIDEAGLGGGLEPVAALAAQIAGNATVSGALTDLLTNPGDVDAAVTTVKTGLVKLPSQTLLSASACPHEL